MSEETYSVTTNNNGDYISIGDIETFNISDMVNMSLHDLTVYDIDMKVDDNYIPSEQDVSYNILYDISD